MFIEIISVSKKTEQDMLPDREDELRLSLAKYGYSLKAIKKTIMHPTLINAELSNIAKSDDKPDVLLEETPQGCCRGKGERRDNSGA